MEPNDSIVKSHSALCEAVGGRIKSVRGDLSQLHFAATLGIHAKTLYKYEAGLRMPEAEVILSLLEKYAVQPLWLLTGEGAEHAPGRLTHDQRELVEKYRRLSKEDQRAVQQMVLAFYERADRERTKRKNAEAGRD